MRRPGWRSLGLLLVGFLAGLAVAGMAVLVVATRSVTIRSGPHGGWSSSMFTLSGCLEVYYEEHGTLPHDARGSAYALYELRHVLTHPGVALGDPTPFLWDVNQEKAVHLRVDYLNEASAADSGAVRVVLAPMRDYWSERIWFVGSDFGLYYAEAENGEVLRDLRSLAGLSLDELTSLEGVRVALYFPGGLFEHEEAGEPGAG